MRKLLVATSLFLFASTIKADILFEGWFEVYIGSKKVGYLAQRYEFTGKQFKMAQYMKTKDDDFEVTETLKGVSDDKLSPVSYTYSNQSGNDIKLIDGSVKGDVLTLKITDGKKKSTESKKIKKGIFLSAFLMYVIMSKENGLSVDKSYDYFAIAEEEGVVRSGSAFVQKKEKVKDQDAFKILNKFKTDKKKDEEKYFVFVTEKGQPLLMRAPEKNVDVRFVKTKDEAIKDFEFDKQHLQIVFGERLPLESKGEPPKPAPKPKKAPEKKPEPATEES